MPLFASQPPLIGKAPGIAGIPLQALGEVGQTKGQDERTLKWKRSPHRGHFPSLPLATVIGELLELASAILGLNNQEGGAWG